MKTPRSSPRSKPSRNLARKPLSTATELAEILGVSAWTVYSWARSKRIPSIRATPRIVRFDADAVLAVLSKGGTR